jgi:hypothetical protein
MGRDAPGLAEAYVFMTPGQRLLAAMISLAVMFAFSAILWAIVT